MEISGKVLREVEFRDRLRGYDTDEVDEFLEKVAVAIDETQAEIDALRRQVDVAEEHARLAQSKVEEVPLLDDDGIRRTLVLAQRTADLAIREARDEAERLLSASREEAARVEREAEERAASLLAETDHEIGARTARLSEQHDELVAEIRVLGQVVEAERTRLTEALKGALRFVSQAFPIDEDVAEIARRELIGTRRDHPRGSGGSGGAPDAGGDLELDPDGPDRSRQRMGHERDVEAEISEDAELARTAPPFAEEPPRPTSHPANASSRRSSGSAGAEAGLAAGFDDDPDEALWAKFAAGAEKPNDVDVSDDGEGAGVLPFERGRRHNQPS